MSINKSVMHADLGDRRSRDHDLETLKLRKKRQVLGQKFY